MTAGGLKFVICSKCMRQRRSRGGKLLKHDRWDERNGRMIYCTGSFKEPLGNPATKFLDAR